MKRIMVTVAALTIGVCFAETVAEWKETCEIQVDEFVGKVIDHCKTVVKAIEEQTTEEKAVAENMKKLMENIAKAEKEVNETMGKEDGTVALGSLKEVKALVQKVTMKELSEPGKKKEFHEHAGRIQRRGKNIKAEDI